jgi:phosphatidylglycerophosphate synthase
MMKSCEEKYRQFARFRDDHLRPIAKIIVRLGIRASGVTYFGIVLMLGFLFTVSIKPKIAFIFFLLAIGMDFLDGVVARYIHEASDRGKFVDMVADNVIFTLFVIGICCAKMVPCLFSLILVYVMVLSKLFRAINNAFDYRSDWFFRAVAGFLPNLICGFCYLSYALYVFFDISVLPYCFIGSSIILFVDSMFHYILIIRKDCHSHV